VVGYEKVKQFVNDDVIPQFLIEIEQLSVEIQVAAGGAGGPFAAHGSHAEPDHIHIKFFRLVANPTFEFSLVVYRLHP
jgi:hypothetical protein